MSDAAENAELVAGFRRLRPAVHEWLARDLTGPPMEYTRAYSDLMFAYAFARLGASDDANAMVRAATEVLSTSAHEAHGWLLRMFCYRVDEALAGKPNSGIFPEEVEVRIPKSVAMNVPVMREFYTTQVLHGISNILDPFGVVNPYDEYTKTQDLMKRRASELRQLRDPLQIADLARAILSDAASLDPMKRAEAWGQVLPCTARAGNEFVGQLLMEVPEVIYQTALTPPAHDYSLRLVLRVIVTTIELAAAMPDGVLFPPLTDAALTVVRSAPQVDLRSRYLGEIGWVCRWFRRLRAFDEAHDFLHHTREWWPKTTAWQSLKGRRLEAEESGLLAATAEAALRRFVGQADADRILDDVVAMATSNRLTTGGTFHALVGVASALAFWPVAKAFDRQSELLSRVRRVGNNGTTAEYYSRSHLAMVEAIVLAYPRCGGI